MVRVEKESFDWYNEGCVALVLLKAAVSQETDDWNATCSTHSSSSLCKYQMLTTGD